MRSPLAALLLAAVAVAAGCDGGQTGGDERGVQTGGDERLEAPQEDASPAAEGGRAPTRAPLGVVSRLDGSSQILARLDSLSLKPLAPRLRLGEYHETWSFSPDRSQLALGMGGVSRICGAGICIVDLDRMRVRKYVDAPIAVEALAWLSPRRIVAVLQSGDLIVADPVTGKTLRRQPLSVATYGPPSARTPGGLAVLLEGDPPQLVVVDAQGRLRVARLQRLRLGHQPPLPPERVGLAVDRRGRRAFVFAAGAPVAEVDLRTMRVRYHRLATPPASAAGGGTRTSLRHALWLGRGLVAVFGEDLEAGRGGGPPARSPAGVQLIDTERWTVRTVQRRASHARVAAGRLLVYTPGPSALRPAGVGLRVYTRDGRRLLGHLFGNEALDVQVAGGHAYARSSRALRIVRVRSGKIVREFALPPPANEIQILNSRLGSGGHSG